MLGTIRNVRKSGYSKQRGGDQTREAVHREKGYNPERGLEGKKAETTRKSEEICLDTRGRASETSNRVE